MLLNKSRERIFSVIIIIKNQNALKDLKPIPRLIVVLKRKCQTTKLVFFISSRYCLEDLKRAKNFDILENHQLGFGDRQCILKGGKY